MAQKEQEKHNFGMLLGMLAPPKARRQKQLVLIEKYLLTHPIFEKVMIRNGGTALREIASNLVVKNYEPDQIIYKLPEDVRTFNFVITGVVNLYADTDSAIEHRGALLSRKDVGELNLHKKVYPNEYFGDRVFTTGRKAQIVFAKATEPTTVIQLNLNTLHKTFEGIFVFRELQLIIELLRNVAIFSKIPSKKIQRILQFSKRNKYPKGHIFFHEGDEPGDLRVILQGEVTLQKRVQLLHDEDSIVSRNFDLSILSKFDTMGVSQILEELPYFSTAVCTSDTIEILQVEKEMAKQILAPYCLERLLDKNKQTWRKRRVTELSSSLSKGNLSPSVSKKENKTDISSQSIQFTIEDRHKLTLTEDKSKPQRKRYERQHRVSLPECRLNCHQRQLSHENAITISQNRGHSHELLQKYMLKKSKKQKIQLMKYAYSKAAQFAQNPQKQYSVVKPLFVKKSQAIKNTMRQIKHSRKHIYNYMLRLTQSLS